MIIDFINFIFFGPMSISFENDHSHFYLSLLICIINYLNLEIE